VSFPLRGAALVLACAIAFAHGADAQDRTPTVTIAARGGGSATRVLDSALARPHVIVAPADGAAHLPLGRSYGSTVIVLGRDATVASRVRGDVIVVGGDLFVHPGAYVEGRAIAIGGGAYPSTLAVVRGGLLSYRDETYDVTAAPGGGFTLAHRVTRVEPAGRSGLLAGVSGATIPSYDRVNGLTVGASPSFAIAPSLRIVPGLAYRSNLGAFDPSAALRFHLRPDSSTWVEARGERGTYTNDAWIYSDLANSAFSISLGRDVRNYWRGDRATLALHHVHTPATGASIDAHAGARVERAWSTGHDSLSFASGDPRTPWSLLGRGDEDRMRRPNPRVAHGTIPSLLAGAASEMRAGDLRARASLDLESALRAPRTGRFTQATLDGMVEFPTFGAQSFRFEAHAVLTAGADAPPQRWAYIGGSGTVPTMELFEQGGDELLFVESRYTVPFTRVELPYIGSPTLMFRHILGGAGVGTLPSLVQNVGARLSVSLVRVELVVDPASGHTRLGAGVSFAR
jgi:hypothetical protein